MKIEDLQIRLAEAEEALRAIRAGEVDTVVVTGKHGPQVFTLEGEEHAYRILIESMNEGALTLMADETILYANECFARMVNAPLEQVTGSSFRRFLSPEDTEILTPLLRRPRKSGFKVQVLLKTSDDSTMPVNISIRPLTTSGDRKRTLGATLGMVVTDMTEARRTEELLRALTQRVLQVQEEERIRVSHELHDTVTQTLCGVLIHSQVLANTLVDGNAPAKEAALKLCHMLGDTVDEVENISRNLRPGILDTLGLTAGLQTISSEFSERTGISVRLASVEFIVRLPADTELALYRILQETLRNVEKHADAHHVTVDLTRRGHDIRLVIHDDGTGFNTDRPARMKGKIQVRGGLGLLGMSERAISVGGRFKIKSTRDHGTETEVRIPFLTAS